MRVPRMSRKTRSFHAHIADNQTVGLHTGHPFFGKTAGGVRIGAFGADITAGAAERQDVAVFLVQFLVELDLAVVQLLASVCPRFHVHRIFHIQSDLGDDPPVVFLHPRVAFRDRPASGGTAPVFVISVALVHCTHVPDLIAGLQGRDVHQTGMGEAHIQYILNDGFLCELVSHSRHLLIE